MVTVTGGYRCTIHTFSSFSGRLGNFLNYGFIIMLWENLLTNCIDPEFTKQIEKIGTQDKRPFFIPKCQVIVQVRDTGALKQYICN